MQVIPQDVLEIIEQYKNKYTDSECALAGHNGPYHMEENEYRNTAHWIISFGTMYRITKDESYLQIVRRFARYLHNAVRATKRGAIATMKGHINLVAISWIVEGLIEAGELLNKLDYFEDAEYIWKSQRYDEKQHLWNIVDDEGNVLGKDVAFNHNLWFALAGVKLYKATNISEYRDIVADFFTYCDSHYMVYRDGRISHFIVNSGNFKFDLLNKVRKLCIEISKAGTPWNRSNQAEYERAYHLFSLYALAQIYIQIPDLKIFTSNKFLKAKDYALEVTNFIDFDEKSNYAYGYNSPYYEFPFVEYIFTRDKTKVIEHMETLRLKQNVYKNILLGKTSKIDDRVTLDARIYELVQLFGVMHKERVKNEQ